MHRLSRPAIVPARRFRTSGFGLAAALLGCLLAPGLAGAQADPAADTWFARWTREVVVQADGTFVETLEDELVIGARAASAGAVQRALHWNASTGTLEVLEAATLKADGSRIETLPRMAVDIEEPAREGVFQDHRYRILTYVGIEAEDRISLKARHHRTVPFFSRHFFDDRGPPERPALEARVIYDVPEALAVHFDAAGYALESEVRDGGRRRITWRHVGHRGVVAEHDVVAPTDYADRLNASTMPDYRTLARTYLSHSYAHPDPTREIRALARELTRDARTDRERVQAIHGWVQRHVRYGGDHLGASTVIPKLAESTLASREGDCKDQATLLESMLAALGIPSSAVMINAAQAYELPSVPTLGVFNHVLVWIPSLQLFADATAKHLPLGELPTALSDKPALIVKTGELVRTPVQRPLVQSIRLDGEIDLDGTASFRLVDTPSGWFAGVRSHFFESADADALRRASGGMLYVSRLIGEASIKGHAEPADSQPVSLVMDGRVSGVMTDDEPPALRALSSVGVGIEIALGDFSPGYERTAPAVCVSAHVDEVASWKLARGLRPVALPGGITIRGHDFGYESRFEMRGQRLEVRRSLRIDVERNVCTPQRMRTLQHLAREVRVDLAKTVRIRRDPSR